MGVSVAPGGAAWEGSVIQVFRSGGGNLDYKGGPRRAPYRTVLARGPEKTE